MGAYVQSRIVSNGSIVEGFLLGFNRELPLFEFVDAGADKEAADNKIKGTSIYHTRGNCQADQFKKTLLCTGRMSTASIFYWLVRQTEATSAPSARTVHRASSRRNSH